MATINKEQGLFTGIIYKTQSIFSGVVNKSQELFSVLVMKTQNLFGENLNVDVSSFIVCWEDGSLVELEDGSILCWEQEIITE